MAEPSAKPRMELLSRDQFDRIHEATLTLLERTGVKVKEPLAFALLKESGCEIEPPRELVRIPRHLVGERNVERRADPAQGMHVVRMMAARP